MKSNYTFGMTVAVDKATGETLAVYLQVRKGRAATVREFENGSVFVNYGREGELLGVEMLAPCRIQVLDSIARKEPHANRIRRFIKGKIPREMVKA